MKKIIFFLFAGLLTSTITNCGKAKDQILSTSTAPSVSETPSASLTSSSSNSSSTSSSSTETSTSTGSNSPSPSPSSTPAPSYTCEIVSGNEYLQRSEPAQPSGYTAGIIMQNVLSCAGNTQVDTEANIDPKALCEWTVENSNLNCNLTIESIAPSSNSNYQYEILVQAYFRFGSAENDYYQETETIYINASDYAN